MISKEKTMFTKLMSSVKSIDVRVVLFLLTLVLFILGAGAPGAVGI
jgi:hypothetical protein